MAKRPIGEGSGRGARCVVPILILVSLAACSLAYLGVSFAFRRPRFPLSSAVSRLDPVDSGYGVMTGKEGEEEDASGECCRGIQQLELWGDAVKWGTDFKLNSSRECCKACKAMCMVDDGPCLCDTWVFCGTKEACQDKFGECWLKKQTNDVLDPAIRDSGEKVMWTSGVIFGKGQGIIGLETEYGTLHIKLFPERAPHSIAYISQLLSNRHCAGCQFYRAESRGQSWDPEGNHIYNASFGPPYGLIQGTLEAEGFPFKQIPKETIPTIRRGSVAWVGSGPEFIISLANHHEWKRAYTVFGSVLSEDMDIAEKIAHLPTKPDVWNNIDVSVLVKPVSLKVRRAIKIKGDLNLKSNTDADPMAS